MLVYKQRAQKETHSTPFLPAPPGGGDGCPSLFTLMGMHTLHAFPMPSSTNIPFLPSACSNSPPNPPPAQLKKQKQRSLPLAEENYSQTSNKRWCFPGVTPLRSYKQFNTPSPSGTSGCDPRLCSENWVGDAGGWVLPRPPGDPVSLDSLHSTDG